MSLSGEPNLWTFIQKKTCWVKYEMLFMKPNKEMRLNCGMYFKRRGLKYPLAGGRIWSILQSIDVNFLETASKQLYKSYRKFKYLRVFHFNILSLYSKSLIQTILIYALIWHRILCF